MSIPNRIAVLNADGTTDTSFDPGAGLDAAGYSVQVKPDGSVIAGGAFSMVSGSVRAKLAVFDSEGLLVSGVPTPNSTVRTLAVQTDGSFLLGGEFTAVDASTRNRIAKIDSDLFLEPAYNPNANGDVRGLLNQEDGKTIVVGAFTSVGGTTRNRIARLFNEAATTNLTVPSVNLVQWLRSGVSQETERVSFELSTDGGTTYSDIAGTTTRITGGWQLVPGASLSGTGIIRARAYPSDSHSNGILEDTVTFNVAQEIQVSDGATILENGVSTVAFTDTQLGTQQDRVITITNVGLSNLTFSGTHVTLATGTQWSVLVQPASPLTSGSSVTFALRFNPTSAGAKTDTVSIHNNDSDENPFTFSLTGTCTPGPGSVDSSWQPVANASSRTIALDSNGDIWLGGLFTTVNALNRLRYASVNTSGTALPQTGTIANGEVFCICQLFDGKVLIGGSFTSVSGVTRNRLARFNADGSFDAAFNVAANGTVLGLALQADGSIIVTGSFTTLGGVAHAGIGKLTSTGTVDNTFNTQLSSVVSASAITQTDGKIVVFGQVSFVGTTTRNSLFRLNADGSLDTTFDASPNRPVFSAALTSDGKVLAGGIYTSIGGASKTGLNRLTAVGAHDSAFSELQAAVLTSTVQCDGKAIVGSFATGSLAPTERLVRLSTTGTNDSTFVATARNTINGLALQEDGKVVLAGAFTVSGGTTRFVARLLNDNNAAISSLSIISPTSVQWLRGGTLPETQIVVFDYSQDSGATWTRLGQGTRISGGWSYSGNSLPISGILRAQAVIPCGYVNGSTTIHEEQVTFSNLAVADLIVEYPVGTVISDGGTINFPGTLPGQNLDQVITLRNTGAATLTGITLATAGDFSVTSAPASSIAANGSTTATIRFSPSAVGARGPIASTITSSVPGSKNPYTLLLTGNGVAVPTATTGSNSAPASGQRTLNGTFRANHDTATAYFQYKLASSSVWLTTGLTTISGFSNTAVSRTITGLTVGQVYQYRAIIYNAVNNGEAPASPFVGATVNFTAT